MTGQPWERGTTFAHHGRPLSPMLGALRYVCYVRYVRSVNKSTWHIIISFYSYTVHLHKK